MEIPILLRSAIRRRPQSLTRHHESSSQRAAMRYTSEGTEIAVTNRGLRRAPPAMMERLLRGEPVDARNVYFRTAPVFEAPAGPLE